METKWNPATLCGITPIRHSPGEKLGKGKTPCSKNTVMGCLTMGTRPAKCVVRWFCCCVKIAECTYTSLGGTAHYTLRLVRWVQPVAPRLQACAACFYTKQHTIKSRSRENNAVERHEMPEAAVYITQQTFYT